MVLCPNCHCDIDESKMFLHQRFCVQNIKYCEQCQVGVIIDEYEEHLQSHNNNSNSPKLSKDESDSLTLKRVQSSKIGCQYCGFLCGFGDIEEHEAMCGARSTNCKQCGKRILIKDLKPHIEKEHNLNMESYQNMESKSSDKSNSNSNSNNYLNNNSSSLYGNLTNLDLQRMTTDEEIAYAMALSEQDEMKRQEKLKKEQEKEKNKYNPKVSDNFQKNNNLDVKKKPSEKIDLDEIEYEYEKQMFEEELKNLEEDNK
jgi:hypothetical protein